MLMHIDTSAYSKGKILLFSKYHNFSFVFGNTNKNTLNSFNTYQIIPSVEQIKGVN